MRHSERTRLGFQGKPSLLSFNTIEKLVKEVRNRCMINLDEVSSDWVSFQRSVGRLCTRVGSTCLDGLSPVGSSGQEIDRVSVHLMLLFITDKSRWRNNISLSIECGPFFHSTIQGRKEKYNFFVFLHNKIFNRDFFYKFSPFISRLYLK